MEKTELKIKRSWKDRLVKAGDRTVDISVLAVLLLCLVSFVVCVIKYSLSYAEILKIWELVWLIPVGLCMLAFFAVIKLSLPLNKTKFLLLWSAVFAVGSAAVIMIFQSPPQGDGGGIYREALRLYNGGDFVMDSSNYYYQCYWLMATVYIEKLLMSVIGTSYTAFKILGTIMLLGGGICLYKITENHLEETTAKLAYGIYVLFAPITLNVSHFAHQHIAFFLLMLSILLLDKPTLPRTIAAGIILGLMDTIRPWGILVIAAILCVGVYKLIGADSWKERGKLIACAAVLLILYFAAGSVINGQLVREGYVDPVVSKDSSMTLIKIDRGIDPEMGDFMDSVKEKTNGLSGDEYNETFNALYRQRIKQLLTSKTAYVYIANKMTRMFGSVDYWFENLFVDKGTIYEFPVRILYFFNWFEYILLLPLSFIGYLKYRKKHTFCLLTVFTVGYVLAHIFIEAFSAYRLCVYPLLIMYAACFLKEIVQSNGKIFLKLKKRKEE